MNEGKRDTGMAIEIDVQVATKHAGLPEREQIETWARAALVGLDAAELTVRLVGREEGAALNQRYRARRGPTNVLSFPADVPAEVGLPLLGDIVICAPVAAEEAAARGSDPLGHWAHLVVHGVLHLRGMDHQDEAGANRMEAEETRLLGELGFTDPYA